MHNDPMINVKQFSSRRLWEIIRLSEIENVSVNKQLIGHIVNELKQREEYNPEQGWHKPH